MPKVQANGIGIAYDEQGAGEPLVLIAGLGYDRWQWHRMAPELARWFRVITPDNRGVGDSDSPPGPYSAEQMAADLVGLLDALGIERAQVLGHSMGGFVAQALALDYPQRVSRLILASTHFGGPNAIPITSDALAVLVDTQMDAATRLMQGLAVSCFPGFAVSHPELINLWTDRRLRFPVDPVGYMAQLGVGTALGGTSPGFEARLAELAIPTLVLFGAQDLVVPTGNAELLGRAIPNSQVVILPQSGHFFPLEVPEAANRAILDFLQGTPTAA